MHTNLLDAPATYLLPRQRATTTLDQMEMLVGLVRAIHVKIQVTCFR